MRKISKYYTILFISICLFFLASCENNTTSNSRSTDQLRQAQGLVEANPKQAQSILNSIPKPEAMSKQNYMEYIVTNTYAKYRLKQDISEETSMVEVLKYFESQQDASLLAKTNFCLGWIYYMNNKPDLAIKHLNSAKDYAAKISDQVIHSRSLNISGYIYFDQDMFDDAIVNYRKALDISKQINSDDIELSILANLGQVYFLTDSLEESQKYWNKALTIALDTDNHIYTTRLYRNLGHIFINNNDYDKALEYFHLSKLKTNDKIELIKSDIIIAKTFHILHRLDSAKYYINNVIHDLPNIDNLDTQKSAYETLSLYYKQTSEYKKALEYNELKEQVSNQIITKNKADKLQKAEFELILDRKQQESRKDLFYNNLYWTISIILIVALAGYLILLIIKEERKAHNLSMDEFRDQVFYLNHVRNERLRLTSEDSTHYKEIMLKMMLLKKHQPEYSTEQEEQILRHKDMPDKVEWAKTFLSKQVCPDELKDGLDDSQLVLLALSFKGYTPYQISNVLNQSLAAIEQSIDNLHKVMSDIGHFTPKQIDHILNNKKVI